MTRPTIADVVRLWPLLLALVAVTGSYAMTRTQIDGLTEQAKTLAPREVVEIKFEAILREQALTREAIQRIDRRLERIDTWHNRPALPR